MDIVCAYNAKDEFEAQALISMLESNEIPCFSRAGNSGDYLRITSNLNIYGPDIMVAEEDKDKARSLIKEMLSSMSGSEDLSEASKEELEFNKALKRKRMIIRIVVSIIAVCGIAGLIFGIVMNFVG